MKNILILCGKAASGKDTLKRYIVEALELSGIEFNNVVNTTTRPPREGEVDGVNYHFCSAEEMTKKILNDEMAEAVLFNDWVYGTENKALSEDKLNVGIFNLEGIEALRQNPNHNIFAVYLDVEDSVRLIRYLNRENMTKEKINEMFRRYKADEIDFADVDDLVDYKLTIEDNENKMVVADRVLRMAFENFEIL
ncbi:MAG: hypothetical protein SOZ53_02675 [Candidatus Onthovivens sp.]|nr:hypothetical protein [Candidatus Onthovivens sp.]